MIVEVGVLNGGSLFMWRSFFGDDARIIGVDLNPDAVWLREEGFEVHIGDQSDPRFWEVFFHDVGDVDILLDDGGHTYPQQIVTAASALDHIRDDGLLVVEDTHTSYMGEFGGPSDTSFVSWAVNLVHGINQRFSAFADSHDPERRVWSVAFFESIVAFHVDRTRAAVVSQQTTNAGVSRGARDFRYRSEHHLSESELRSFFTH
ncbi:MAG: class I SAM-dependent methyltransferase [Microbacterium sp.]